MEGDRVFNVPRLRATFHQSDVKLTVQVAVQKLGYEQPTSDQSKVIEAFISRKDVLVCLLTSSGKS